MIEEKPCFYSDFVISGLKTSILCIKISANYLLWINQNKIHLLSPVGAKIDKVHILWEGHKILWNIHCRFVLCSASQIYGGDFTKFIGVIKIYELYNKLIFWIPLLSPHPLWALCSVWDCSSWFHKNFRRVYSHKLEQSLCFWFLIRENILKFRTNWGQLKILSSH